MECQWWCIGIMTIYVGTIANIFVPLKLKALCHGDHFYCQCQGSKDLKDKNIVFDPWEIYISLEV